MTHPAAFRPIVYLLDIAALVVCTLGLVHIAAKPGIPVAFASRMDTVYCARVGEPLSSRIHEREVLLQIDGRAISTVDDVEFILDDLRVGDHVLLTLKGAEGVRSEEVELGHYYGAFYLVSVIIVSSLFFIVGLLVFWRKPDDPAGHVYHFGSIGTAVMLSTTWGSVLSTPAFLGPALRAIFSTMYAFVPLFFFHFIRLFPSPRENRLRSLLPFLYGLAAILAIGTSTAFIAAFRSGVVTDFHTYLTWFTFTRWFMIALVFSGLWTIRQSYREATDEEERRKIRWVVWGLFIGFVPFVVLWVIPLMFLSYGLVPESVMLLASGFIPLAFGASIVKYHIMDIDLILNRSVVYGTVMAFIALLYILVVGGAAGIASSFTYQESIGFSAGAAIIVALLFEPARRVVQREVDRRFFRIRYDYRRAQRRFQEDLSTCVVIEDVVHLLVERVSTILAPERIAFVSSPRGGWPGIQEGRDLSTSEPALFDALSEEVEQAAILPLSVSDRIEPGVPFTLLRSVIPDHQGIVLVHASRGSDGRILGLLLLGKKRSGSRFSSEDVDLLASLLQQVGVEIERDILKKEVMEKAERADRLERLNAMKSDFVSYVSHELRTPLTSIKMFAEMLQQRIPRGEKHSRDYVRIIQGETDRLQRMVNTILDSARIDRGDVHYACAPVRLDTIVKDVLAMLRYQLAKEGFTVSIAMKKRSTRGGLREGTFMIHADADAVREALLNLLSNAMKYALDDKRIRVSLWRTGGDVRCSIQDHGRGISKEALGHLFERFYRDPALPRQVQGVGIGLSVVKHIMDEHQGKIEVESSPGIGSTFTLVFPLRRVHPPTNT